MKFSFLFHPYRVRLSGGILLRHERHSTLSHVLGRREHPANSVARVNAHNGFAGFESDISHSHRPTSDYRYDFAVRLDDVALFPDERISGCSSVIEIFSHLKDEFVITS